jgi:ferredoxin-thioredoxin reductase catalytic subunit
MKRPRPWILRGTGLADARLNLGRQAMKTIVSSLIALSVLAGICVCPCQCVRREDVL